MQEKIKLRPLSAGEVFTKAVRRGVTLSGKYGIFYSWLPVDAKENSQVHSVNLNTILPTESSDYNELILGLVQADLL